MRLELTGGSYQARWVGANAQRCINLYPEKNQGDSPVPLTHYQRGGLTLLGVANALGWRCLYRASNGNGYGVAGQNVYSISSNWVLTTLGQLLAVQSTPVKMIDNGSTIWLVDNSKVGYSIDLTTNAFAQIVDPTGIFQGGTTVDVIDTFMLTNTPGTAQFLSTLSNQLTFDALYFAMKADYPDPLVSLIVNRHEIILLGALKSEIWYDAGNAGFPFAELPGAYIEHGCVAPYSVAAQDISVYWLGQDLQGQGIVFRQRGYETKRISTHAIENMIQAGRMDNAIAYIYQQLGHIFYVLILPTQNLTLVYDEASELWHQRAWTNPVGQLMRDRTNCAAFMYGTNVAGDWENGNLYKIDPNVYTDNGDPITFIRGFPHLVQLPDGISHQPVKWDGKRVKFKSFVADIQCGAVPMDQFNQQQIMSMRFSDDRGVTFGEWMKQGFGVQGSQAGTLTQPIWRDLGEARDRVFEIMYSVNGPAALNGGWVDAEQMNT